MKPKKTVTWRGKFSLKGVKSLVGIDSSVLIDLALYEKSVEYFKSYGFQFPSEVFCVTTNSIGEAKGVLINKYKKSLAWVNKRIDDILDQFYIQKIMYEDDFYQDAVTIERIGEKYGLNEEDVPIILTMWKHGVSIVMVRDKAFEDTCKELGIDVIGFPIVESFK